MCNHDKVIKSMHNVIPLNLMTVKHSQKFNMIPMETQSDQANWALGAGCLAYQPELA